MSSVLPQSRGGASDLPVLEFILANYHNFNARAVRDALISYWEHVSSGGRMFWAMEGAMSSAQLGISLAPAIRAGLIHGLSVTGMGLLGHILEVEFPLSRIPSSWILMDTERVPDIDRFLAALDRLNEFVIAAGGRIYLTKDRFTRPEHFRAMEPRPCTFLAAKERWDREHQLRSAQSVRLFGGEA